MKATNVDYGGTKKLLIRRPSSLGDEVYEAILGLLLRLDIAPGSRIAVDSLVKKLGVSQTPIRQALARLESEGLVQKIHLLGYSATPQLEQKQFEELFSIRTLLEPYLARLAASYINDKELVLLEAIADEMTQYRPRDIRSDYGLFAKKDAQFHAKIAAISRHQLAQDTLNRLHVHLHMFRLVFHPSVTSEAIDEHAAILAALRLKDPQAAESAMRNHLEQAKRRFSPAVK
ncbi:MAG: GntR family transcriptional regulator [Aestuariivirga sp.]